MPDLYAYKPASSLLIVSIVALIAGVVGGRGAVVRWTLSMHGTVTDRKAGLRGDVLLSLDGKQKLRLDHREAAMHDLLSLQVGDRIEKRASELAVVVNGTRRPWRRSEAWPAFVGCMLALLGLTGLLAHAFRRRRQSPR